MVVDDGIVRGAINHQLSIINKEITEILQSEIYISSNGTRIKSLTARAVTLLAARKRLVDGGNALSRDRATDAILKPFLRNALEAYRGTVTSEKIGTDKDTKINVVTAQIAEFRS